MKNWWKAHAKAVVAAVLALAAVYVTTGHIDENGLLALAVALGVGVVPNKPE